MKRIPLTQGKEALVDDQDYEYLMRWRWHAARSRDKGLFYGGRTDYSTGHKRTVFIHQEVARRAGMVPGHYDHRDGNGLDDRRSNLRLADGFENQSNRGPNRNNKAGPKGVYFEAFTGRYRAELMARGRRYKSRRFHTIVEATKAYNKLALEHHGEFAWLNPIPAGKKPRNTRSNTGELARE